VASCLGHVMSFKGIFGEPKKLCTHATRRLCNAIEASREKVVAVYRTLAEPEDSAKKNYYSQIFRNVLNLANWGRTGSTTHSLSHNPNLLDASTLGCINNVNDLAVRERSGARNKHGLVPSRLKDFSES